MSMRVSGALILRALRGVVVMGAVMLTVPGCMARYALDRRPVKQISEAERKSRGRAAFERARERVREVRPRMSPGEVQSALGAVIAVEEGPEGETGGQRKLMRSPLQPYSGQAQNGYKKGSGSISESEPFLMRSGGVLLSHVATTQYHRRWRA